MPINTPCLLMGCFLLLSSSISSLVFSSEEPTAEWLDKANELKLYDRNTWRRLLHIRPAAEKSSILSQDFFLTTQEKFSAKIELANTIRAFAAPDSGPVDQSARCRFPARFLWLSQYLEFEKSLSDCKRLNDWARLGDLRSISLVMVSGYFGNPASSFGHTLLKINNHSYPSRLGLLDLGVNFGALVPENELTAVYIAKGLFGGYQAGFSDKKYYSQDQVYSRTEFRDMWEYPLQLSEFQNQLLVFHIWEITGKKFQYFFLKQNCSYRLAELIEIVVDSDMTSENQVWFAPVELMHKIRDHDKDAAHKLFAQPIFIPSDERILTRAIEGLTSQELEVFYAYINTPDADYLKINSQGLRAEHILNTLLSYYQFKLASLEDDEGADLRQAKEDVLKVRLGMPVSAVTTPQIPSLRPPSAGSKPSRLTLESHFNKESKAHAGFGYSAFYYDNIGDNVLNGSSLVVFDLAVGVSEQHDVFLERLVFVAASKNKLKSVPLPGESASSWDIGVGLRRESLYCLDCVAAYAGYRAGKAFAFSEEGIAAIKLGFDYDHRETRLSLEPVLSLIINRQASWGAQLDFKHQNALDGKFKRSIIRLESRHSLGDQLNLRVAMEQYVDGEDIFETSLSLEKRL